MNNVSLIGRLGKDPELHVLNGTKRLVTFSIAVDNPYSSDEQPDWIPVQAWGKTASVIAEHKRKGDQVAITGRLTSSEWTDDDGTNHQRHYVTADRVDFLANAKEVTD